MKRKLPGAVIINLVWIFYCLLVLFTGDLIPLEFADTGFKSCGAYDRDFPIYKAYRVVPLTSFFNYVTKIDSNKMNMTGWIKAN